MLSNERTTRSGLYEKAIGVLIWLAPAVGNRPGSQTAGALEHRL
jgi:hypothetical protein